LCDSLFSTRIPLFSVYIRCFTATAKIIRDEDNSMNMVRHHHCRVKIVMTTMNEKEIQNYILLG
jgi:hypothetical protein